jgi:hypothetical protein
MRGGSKTEGTNGNNQHQDLVVSKVVLIVKTVKAKKASNFNSPFLTRVQTRQKTPLRPVGKIHFHNTGSHVWHCCDVLLDLLFASIPNHAPASPNLKMIGGKLK